MRIRWLINLLFPMHVRCAFCGEEKKLLPYAICPQCMNQLKIRNTTQCNITYALEYDKSVSSAIQHFKYNAQRYIGFTLANFLADAAREAGLLLKPVDYVTSVPLHPNRLKERGFNQSALLANEFCYITHLSYVQVLTRIKDTQSQTKLTAPQRQQNVKGVFSLKQSPAGKRIILIDDVATTGATLLECRSLLLSAGAADVLCLCVAHA